MFKSCTIFRKKLSSSLRNALGTRKSGLERQGCEDDECAVGLAYGHAIG